MPEQFSYRATESRSALQGRSTPEDDPSVVSGNVDAFDLLRAGVEQAMTEEGYGQWLTTVARFPTYSLRNQLLIAKQMPSATHVASFGAWKRMDRHVMRGEKGLKIFAPVKKLVPNEETGELERQVVAYRVASTFDLSQTEGKPFTPPTPLPELRDVSDRSREVQTRLFHFLREEEGTRVESREIHGLERGYYNYRDNLIVLRKCTEIDPETGEEYLEVDPFSVGKTKTLFHEAAHRLAGHTGTTERRGAEVVAESSAYIAMHHYQLDSLPYSRGYVARWSRDMETFFKEAEETRRVSNMLISAVGGTPLSGWDEEEAPATD